MLNLAELMAGFLSTSGNVGYEEATARAAAKSGRSLSMVVI
jgi:hypothetical protein